MNVLTDEKAKLQWEVESGKSETNAYRQTIQALKEGVKNTIARLGDSESNLEAARKENEELKSRLAEQTKEPSDQELMDRLRTTELYQSDMYDVAVEGFNTARDFMVMKNLITAQQGEEMNYEEAFTSLEEAEETKILDFFLLYFLFFFFFLYFLYLKSHVIRIYWSNKNICFSSQCFCVLAGCGLV